MKTFTVVGKRIPNIDIEKVTGDAKYVNDLFFPNMLCGKILRSPYAHANIKSIDVSRAKKLEGVKAVVTFKDTLGIKWIQVGPPFEDKYPLSEGKVRYVGDEIAAVAAIDENTAEKALSLIKVDYEKLPSVFNPEEAMLPGAPQIHEHVENNISVHRVRNYGNAEKAFQKSDLIFEDKFVVGPQSHGNLEPNGSISYFDEKGVLHVWSSTQSPYFVRKELSHIFDIPVSKVIIKRMYAGGGFGARSKVCEDEIISALLSQKSGQPVKVIYSREEELTTTRIRHPMIMYLKTGVKKDGNFMAREMKIIADNGAYNHCGPAVLGYAVMVTSSLYKVKDVKVESYLVYTNKHFGGPYRGYGVPQVAFAIESQIDKIAKELGIDPLELRLKNIYEKGYVTPCGFKITSCGLKECLEKAAEAIGYKDIKKSSDPFTGVGIASLIHCSGARVYADGDFSSATVKANSDGFVTLLVGNADCGTWSNTTLSQIAAEELGVSMDKIHLICMDTEKTPMDMGSWGSRTTFIAGNAVKIAARDLKEQLIRATVKELGGKEKDFYINDGIIQSYKSIGKVKLGESTVQFPLGDAVLASTERIGQSLYGKGHYEPNSEFIDRSTGTGNISAAYSFAAHAAKVKVDPDTGETLLEDFVGVHDVGQPINPIAVEGQIQGAIAQGVGYALMEKFTYDDNGNVLENSFADYKMPTVMDLPFLKTHIVDIVDDEGPFGAKGVGEPGIIPVAPAIINAIYDATGSQIKILPATPEKIYWGIKKDRSKL